MEQISLGIDNSKDLTTVPTMLMRFIDICNKYDSSIRTTADCTSDEEYIDKATSAISELNQALSRCEDLEKYLVSK